MIATRRRELRDRLDSLAREFRPHSPFTTSVLHVLIGAMDLGIDRRFAAAAVAWLTQELEETRASLDEMLGAASDRPPSANPSDN